MPYYKTRLNKVGIPAEIKTVKVPACYWDGNFNFKPTTRVVKFYQAR